MGTYATLIAKADLILDDLAFLTQPELEPTANFSYVDNHDGTVALSDTSTINTPTHVTPNVTVTEWRWQCVETGETSSAAGPTFNFTKSGNFTVRLTVTTNYGWQATVLKVVAVAIAPTAQYSWEIVSVTTDAVTIRFIDQSYGDQSAHILLRSWDFDDGSGPVVKSATTFTYTYVPSATPTPVLTITSENGEVDVFSTPLSWAVVNKAPGAAFTHNRTGDRIVTFTDTSVDDDGIIVAWLWEFGDGTTSAIQNPTHVFPTNGIWQVKLTVTDDGGKTNSITKTVDVSTAPPAYTLTAGFTIDSCAIQVIS